MRATAYNRTSSTPVSALSPQGKVFSWNQTGPSASLEMATLLHGKVRISDERKGSLRRSLSVYHGYRGHIASLMND